MQYVLYTVPVRLLWNGGPLTFSDLHHVLTSFNICFGVYIKQQCHSDITDKKVIEISLFVFHFSSFIKRVPSCPFYYLLSIMMVKRTCKQTIVKISFVKNQDFFSYASSHNGAFGPLQIANVQSLMCRCNFHSKETQPKSPGQCHVLMEVINHLSKNTQ